MEMDDDPSAFEKKARENGFAHIAGVDEAGRGPLAGPVVAAAVVLPESLSVTGISDSKRLTAKARERLYDQIYCHAVSVGIGIVDPVEIDRINILQASLTAMSIAVDNLKPIPDYLLIDGIFSIPVDLPQQAIPKGDARSVSIGAASIVAKVTLDRIMEGYSHQYPEFDFHRHKGYATRAHYAAIRRFGCCPIHRRSFKGVTEDGPRLQQRLLFDED